MPKLKSVIAGLAAGAALTGGLVAGGATAAVAAPTAAPIVANDDWDGNFFGHHHGFFGHHHHGKRCGRHHWGGYRSKRVCVVVRNFNVNDNERRNRHHRWDGD
ncbi:hypothetical protein ACQEUU_31250 [Nonomuraea sp. CA-218870]|uniref:hypothetical protein n=1 Tax=Nonomuraea sp. CA-218870 TaxID=3239998 RepID=UPI003D8CF048